MHKEYDPDHLKPIDRVFEADARSGSLVKLPSGEQVAFDWHYEQISNIQLSAKVFADIKTQFETAKNAYLYSWFAYRLAMVAWLQAYSSLELTLRLTAETQGFKIRRLRRLLEKANSEKWIDFDEFIKTKSAEEYIKIKCNFRNNLSHGSHLLLSPEMILPFISDCACMINQVFEKELLINKGSSVRDGWF